MKFLIWLTEEKRKNRRINRKPWLWLIANRKK